VQARPISRIITNVKYCQHLSILMNR
jgi:hypothetical protein